ncbi:MAG: hypothetical protein AABY22_18180 [Nanoarchaeota archaeon]
MTNLKVRVLQNGRAIVRKINPREISGYDFLKFLMGYTALKETRKVIIEKVN